MAGVLVAAGRMMVLKIEIRSKRRNGKNLVHHAEESVF